MKQFGAVAIFGSLLVLNAAAQPATNPQSATADQPDAALSRRTIWVPPPTGSLLGGGYVPVANEVSGEDEAALLGTINQLNAAAGSKAERPYVVMAIARSTGVSAQELQTQQNLLRLRFGELCAINTIARGDRPLAQRIATLKEHDYSWTQLAHSHGLTISHLVQTARNARQITSISFTRHSVRPDERERPLSAEIARQEQKAEPITAWVDPNHASNRLLPYTKTKAALRETTQAKSIRSARY